MTTLLPQPLPWPSGEALPWARSLRWEGVPALGSMAIQPVPHGVDEQSLPSGQERWLTNAGIPGLIVRCLGSAERPSWHRSNGLYGFVGVPAGNHVVTVEDPQGRYLPARLSVIVSDRSAVAASLRQLERPSPPDDWRRLVHRVTLRPAPGAPAPSGATAIWGVVQDAAGRPIPLALLQLDTDYRNQPATATTWSDAAGGYRLSLDGERPDPLLSPPDQVERTGRLSLPLNPVSSDARRWIQSIPELDGALVQGIRSGSPPSGYGPVRISGSSFRFREGSSGRTFDRLPLRIGRSQRWDAVLN